MTCVRVLDSPTMTSPAVSDVSTIRPALKKGLRVLRRDDLTLQLGLDPDRAVVFAAPSAAVTRLVAALDGRAEVRALARRHRLPVATVVQVVADLAAAGVLEEPAPTGPAPGRPAPAGSGVAGPAAAGPGVLQLVGDRGPGSAAGRSVRTLRRVGAAVAERERRLEPDIAAWGLVDGAPGSGRIERDRRAAATVRVVGSDRVGTAVGLLLAASGIGQIVAGDDRLARHVDNSAAGLGQVDVGRPRRAGLRRRLAEVAPGARLLDRHPCPALAVVTDAGADTDAVAHLQQAGTPHLVVGVRETLGWVGPLVVPGRTSCLNCHHLTRTDRDPAWALLVDQLAVAARPPLHLSGSDGDSGVGPPGKIRGTTRGAPAVEACDGVLATLVAATAVLHTLTWLSGQVPPSVDGTVEFRLPDGFGRRRSWSVHPGCACAPDAPPGR